MVVDKGYELVAWSWWQEGMVADCICACYVDLQKVSNKMGCQKKKKKTNLADTQGNFLSLSVIRWEKGIVLLFIFKHLFDSAINLF